MTNKGYTMKLITKIVTIMLLLSTTVLTASEDFKLLNDMKFAQKQQLLLLKMTQELEVTPLNRESFQALQTEFKNILTGLSNGDKKMNLKGSTLTEISIKLSEVQTLWKNKEAQLNGSKTKQAIAGLKKVMLKMDEAVTLYTKSYKRYQQRSRFSLLISRHMTNQTQPMLAFNVIF